MFKKVICLSFICCLFGCTTPWKPTVYDVFQVPATTRIYLASNLWYSNPVEMSSFNYQNGKVLPFGTEVVDVDFDDEFVTFKSKDTGKVYGIKLMKNYAMISMHQYLKEIFMITNPVEIELSIKATVFEKLSRGIAEKGMTKEQVRIAYGKPSLHRTPSMDADTWIYQESPTATKRVVFRKGVVTSILNY